MEMNMNVVNVTPVNPTFEGDLAKMNKRILDRARHANAEMHRQMHMTQKFADATAAENALNAIQISSMKEQLVNAKKTISELEQKVRALTASLEKSFEKPDKKDKKSNTPKPQPVTTITVS